MDALRFNQLVESLEELARRDPDALRHRIRGLIALGYLYVLGVLAIVIGLIVALVLLSLQERRSAGLWKLILALGVLAVVILRALWVKVEAPTGERLTRKQAPKLFERVEAIRRTLKAPRPHIVLLTQDFNAAVTQVPLLGIFGGHRTYLIVGLPLMYALGPRHFDAVLGHEFGHLSGSHPKYGLWVFRVGAVWGQLLAQLERSKSWFNRIFDGFFKWYVPRLNAHGYALRRDDEFAADADSALTTDPKLAAEALASVAVGSAAYGEFWGFIQKRLEHDPEPPARNWTRLPDFLKEIEASPRRVEWLASALRQENLVEDSHPALRHRLKALKSLDDANADPGTLLGRLVPASPTSAATHYLGEFGAGRLAAWDEEWRELNAEPWNRAHLELKQVRLDVDALVARDVSGESLGVEELWTVAAGLDRLDGDDAALPWLQRVIAADATHAAAHYTLGRVLLARQDREGEPLVKRAMELEPAAIPGGNAMLRQFHASIGDREAILRTDVESDAHFERLRHVESERTELRRKDRLEPAILPPSELTQVVMAAQEPAIAALWLAQKVPKAAGDKPVIVILIEPKRKILAWGAGERDRLAQFVLGNVTLELNALIVLSWDEHAGWITNLMRDGRGLRMTAGGNETLAPHRWYRRYRTPLIVVSTVILMLAYASWG